MKFILFIFLILINTNIEANYIDTYTSSVSANCRSEEIAISQGCTGNITKYWFPTIKHATQDKYALDIWEGCYECLLTQDEQNNLKTYSQLNQDGWFVEEEQMEAR